MLFSLNVWNDYFRGYSQRHCIQQQCLPFMYLFPSVGPAHCLCVYTPLCSSFPTVHEERYSAADRHSLKPSCQIWDHVWSLRRVCQPGGDHRQFLGGETAGNSLWQIKPNWELTLPSDKLSLNLLCLGGEKKDLGPRLSAARRHRFTHKHMSSILGTFDHWAPAASITQHNDKHLHWYSVMQLEIRAAMKNCFTTLVRPVMWSFSLSVTIWDF